MTPQDNNNRLAKLIKDTMEHPMNYYVPPFKMLDRVYGLNGLSKAELRESGFGEDMQLKFYNTLTTQQELHVDCYTPAPFKIL